MTLDQFIEKEKRKMETNSQPQTQTESLTSQVEWDGKDFRGEKPYPYVIEYVKQHPLVLKWIHNRPSGSMRIAVDSLKGLSKFANMNPEKFLTLDKKSARDLAWE